jgi:hypothetical protein
VLVCGDGARRIGTGDAFAYGPASHLRERKYHGPCLRSAPSVQEIGRTSVALAAPTIEMLAACDAAWPPR